MWTDLTTSSAESLEDRLRRMAVANGANQVNAATASTPVVRPSPTHNTLPVYGREQANFEHQGRISRSSPQMSVPHGQFIQPNQLPGHQHQFASLGRGGMQGHRSNPPGHSVRSSDGVDPHQRFPNRPSYPKGRGGQRSAHQQHIQLDPNEFQRGHQLQHRAAQSYRPHRLQESNRQSVTEPLSLKDMHDRQANYLDEIAMKELPHVRMSESEQTEKESFRRVVEQICHEVSASDPENLPKVSLECFGSFKSGFASAGSDMDLVIVVTDSEKPNSACFSLLEYDLPRALEKALLQRGLGARLLTRTRVPIIKLCQEPGVSLLDKLREEREKWESLPNEKKYPHLYPDEDEVEDGDIQPNEVKTSRSEVQATVGGDGNLEAVTNPKESMLVAGTSTDVNQPNPTPSESGSRGRPANHSQQKKQSAWVRERKAGPLDFPKTGIGIQSDINFFNPLGLHNTQMLRCYSLGDDRVRPMVHLVKAWAKRRKINSSYSGTLSSYGYVLMVLHYLVNVAQPPVLPNLQQPWRPGPNCSAHGASSAEVDGWTVSFWRNEDEILMAKAAGQLTSNVESVSSLLAGFFHYYSSLGGRNQFRWVQQVLSLRTPTGILSKEAKGWTKATTEEGEGKKIQHRYLFCIEDPFELSHNVARTVTHNGIVAIRDEFRRAHGVLNAVGRGLYSHQGNLFDELVEKVSPPQLPPDLQKAADAPDGQIFDFRSNPAKAKALDVTDNDAFPTLGNASAKSKGKSNKTSVKKDGEISGERAKQLLEELKKKKEEEDEAETRA